LPTTYKTLSNIPLSRLIPYVEEIMGIINADSDAIDQLRIMYSVFVKYLRKNGNNEAVHQLFIDFKKAYASVRRQALYNILIEFGVPKKLVRLIKMCLIETYSRIWVGKNLSGMFPNRNVLKQGDALLPLLFNLALEYAIKRVQVNQDGLKVSGKHQIVAYADDVHILGGSVHTVKENAEALAVVTKEIGLEVNANKTKYMVMSREQNAGLDDSLKTDSSSIERVEGIKYVGTTLTDQNLFLKKLRAD
jgi:hypothetical protein